MYEEHRYDRTSDLSFPGVTIHLSTPMVAPATGREPDPKWRHLDSNGHLHAWVKTSVPTVRKIIDEPGGFGFDTDGEEYNIDEVAHYECVTCSETVPDPPYRDEKHPKPHKAGPRENLATVTDAPSDGTTRTREVWLTDEEVDAVAWAMHAKVCEIADANPGRVTSTTQYGHG